MGEKWEGFKFFLYITRASACDHQKNGNTVNRNKYSTSCTMYIQGDPKKNAPLSQ